MILTKTNSKKEIQELILPLDYSEKISLLYGILLGDGCLSKVGKNHHFITITGHATDDGNFFNNIKILLEELTGRNCRIKERDKNTIEFNFTNKTFFTFIKSLEFPVGKKGPNLKIPSFFKYEAYNNIVKGILQLMVVWC